MALAHTWRALGLPLDADGGTRCVPRAAWGAVDLGAAQLDEVRGLFAHVFGLPMAASLWHWKYGSGRGVATGTRSARGPPAGTLRWHGTRLRLLVAGVPVCGVQVGDVMVAQAGARGVLSRRGPFAVAARGFVERYIGVPDGFACGFGFPNDRAARLGKVLGLYRDAATVLQLRWPQARGLRALALRWKGRLAPIDWSDVHTDERLNALWRGLSQGSWIKNCVLPQRDAAWWRHRFANHPHTHYRCYWVRSRCSGRVLGAVALRPGAGPASEWELLDCLAFGHNLPAVAAAARSLCMRLGASAMTGWLSEPLALRLLSHELLADAHSEIACSAITSVRQWPSLPDPASTTLWWWLTGGDTDFR